MKYTIIYVKKPSRTKRVVKKFLRILNRRKDKK